MQILFRNSFALSLESPDQAIITCIAINLAKKGESHPAGFHFTIKPENGMIFLYPEVFLNPFVCGNGQDLLFPSFHLYLVILSENFKQ